jgi:PAS domain S-box-containing protein
MLSPSETSSPGGSVHREATERGSRSRKRTMGARARGSVGSARAEDEALARAREWLGHQRAAILTATGDGICGLDADGRVTFSNPALHRLLGRSESEIHGERLHDLVHRRHDGGEDHGCTACHFLARGERRVEAFDLDVHRGDGSTIAVEYVLVALENDLSVSAVSLHDITESQRAARLLRVAMSQLQAATLQRAGLLDELARAEERERARIAADIHDDTVQVLGALGLRLEQARRGALDREAEGVLGRACEEVRDATTRLRHLMFDLMPPPSEGGLRGAVRAYCSVLFAGTPITYAVEGDTEGLAPESGLLAYRLAQEALRNVLKHSRADRVLTTFDLDGEHLLMCVADDGVGLAATPGEWPLLHAGLRMIRQRAEAGGGSAVTDVGLEGRGSSIAIRLPLRARNQR